MNTTSLQNSTNDNFSQDFNDMLSQDVKMIQPLTSADRFFKKVLPENRFDASWQRKWFENFSGYADKYAQTVDVLYQTVRKGHCMTDSATYPIMFLCRHCIELRLKSLICVLTTKKKCNGHVLVELWKKFDNAYCSDKTNEQYLTCQNLISELGNYDKQSDTFRYHIHNDGTSTAQYEFVDIDQFYATFKKVNWFLEGLEEVVNPNK